MYAWRNTLSPEEDINTTQGRPALAHDPRLLIKTDIDFYKQFEKVRNCVGKRGLDEKELTDDLLQKYVLAVLYGRSRPNTKENVGVLIRQIFGSPYDNMYKEPLKSRLAKLDKVTHERLGLSQTTVQRDSTTSTAETEAMLQSQRKQTEIKLPVDLFAVVEEKIKLMGGNTPLNQDLQTLVTELREEEARLLTESRRGTLAGIVSSAIRTTTSNKENVSPEQNRNLEASDRYPQKEEESKEVSDGVVRSSPIPIPSRKGKERDDGSSSSASERSNATSSILTTSRAGPSDQLSTSSQGSQSPQASLAPTKSRNNLVDTQSSRSLSSSAAKLKKKSPVDQLSHSLQKLVFAKDEQHQNIIDQMLALGDSNKSKDLSLVARIKELDKLLKQSNYSKSVFEVYQKINEGFLEEFSNQLIDLNRNFFKSVDLYQFSMIGLKEPNMALLTDNFNKLSQFVTLSILDDDINQRILMLTRMINIAKICDEKGDCSSAMAIMSGLQLTVVQRLKNTLSSLSPSIIKTYDRLIKKYDATKMAKDLRHAANPNIEIPHFGPFGGALTLLKEGNPDKNWFDTPGGVKIMIPLMHLQKRLIEKNVKPLSSKSDIQIFLNSVEKLEAKDFDALSYPLSYNAEERSIVASAKPGEELKKEAKSKEKLKPKVTALYSATTNYSEEPAAQMKDIRSASTSSSEQKPDLSSKADAPKLITTDVELLNAFDQITKDLSSSASHSNLNTALLSWGNTTLDGQFEDIKKYNQPISFAHVTSDSEDWKKLQTEILRLREIDPNKMTEQELFELVRELSSTHMLRERYTDSKLSYKLIRPLPLPPSASLASTVPSSIPQDILPPPPQIPAPPSMSVASTVPSSIPPEILPPPPSTQTSEQKTVEVERFTPLYFIKDGKLVVRQDKVNPPTPLVAELLKQQLQNESVRTVNIITKTLSDIEDLINVLMRQAVSGINLNIDLINYYVYVINQKYDQLLHMLDSNENLNTATLRQALVIEKEKFGQFANKLDRLVQLAKVRDELGIASKIKELQQVDLSSQIEPMERMLDKFNQDSDIKNIFIHHFDPTDPKMIGFFKTEAKEQLLAENLSIDEKRKFENLTEGDPIRDQMIEKRAILLAKERAKKFEFKDIIQAAYQIKLSEHGGQTGHIRNQAENAAVDAYIKDPRENPELKKLINSFADAYSALYLARARQEDIKSFKPSDPDDIVRLDAKLQEAIAIVKKFQTAKLIFDQEMENYSPNAYRSLISQAEQFRRIQYEHKNEKPGQPGYREPTQAELNNISIYVDADALSVQKLESNPLTPYSTALGSVYNSLSKPMWMVMNGGKSIHVRGRDKPGVSESNDQDENKAYLAAIPDKDPNYLSTKARGYAVHVTRAITVNLDACGGWDGAVVPYDEDKKPTVLMLARGAPQLDDPELEEYKACIVDNKSDPARIAKAREEGQPRFILLQNKDGHYIGRKKTGTITPTGKKPSFSNDELVYLDTQKYLELKKREICEKLRILKAKHDSDGRPIYFKTSVIGAGAFAWLNGNPNNDIGKMLEPLFFQAYHEVITDDEGKREYTHENMVIEFVAYGANDKTNTQLTAFKEVFGSKLNDKGVANISGVIVKPLVGRIDREDISKSTMGVSPTDYRHVENPEKYILAGDPGADNGSVFGNELQYASLEAEVANDAASSRGVGSPLVNPLMLDPRHQYIFDKKQNKYVTVAKHLQLRDDQIEDSKPAEVRDLELWNKNRKVFIDLIKLGDAEKFKEKMSKCNFSAQGKEEVLKALHDIVTKNEFDGKPLIDHLDKGVSEQVLHFTQYIPHLPQIKDKLTASQYKYAKVIQDVAVDMKVTLQGVDKIDLIPNYNIHLFFEKNAVMLISLLGKHDNREKGAGVESLSFEGSIKEILNSYQPALTPVEKLEVIETIFSVIEKNKSLILDAEKKPLPYYKYIDKGGAIFKAKQEGTTKTPLTDTQMRHIKSLKTIYFDIVRKEYDGKMAGKKDSVKNRTAALAGIKSAIDKEGALVDFSNSNFLLTTGETGTRTKINALKTPPTLSKVYVTPAASSKDIQAAKTRKLIDDLNKIVDEIIAAQAAGKHEKAAVLVRAYLGKDNTFIEKLGKAVFGNTREQFVKIAADTAETDKDEDPLTKLITQANKNLASVIADTGIMGSSHWPEKNAAHDRLSQQLQTKIHPASTQPPSTQVPQATGSESQQKRSNVSSGGNLQPFIRYSQSYKQKEQEKQLREELVTAINQIQCVAIKDFLLRRFEEGKISHLPDETFIKSMVDALNTHFAKHDVIPTYAEYNTAFRNLKGMANDLAEHGDNKFITTFNEEMNLLRKIETISKKNYIAILNEVENSYFEIAANLKNIENILVRLHLNILDLDQEFKEDVFHSFKSKLLEIQQSFDNSRANLNKHLQVVTQFRQDLLFVESLAPQYRDKLKNILDINVEYETLPNGEKKIKVLNYFALQQVEKASEKLKELEQSVDRLNSRKNEIEASRKPAPLETLTHTLMGISKHNPSSKDH